MTGVKPLFEPRAGAKPAALYNGVIRVIRS